MFHDSSQRTRWIFSDSSQIQELRRSTNREWCAKHKKESLGELLTWEEEEMLCAHYLHKLLEFCNLFQPPIPRAALGTAVAYFKRFYLHTSVMEYHPKDIFLCCAYLSFKVEEYNVNVDQFVHVLKSDLRTRIAEMILSYELMVMQRLKFHLTIHSPFRPLEGFIIDMKTRCPHLANPEVFRQKADDFLLHSCNSDVSLLFPPSQIALAAVRHAAKSVKLKVDEYLFILLDSDKTAADDVLATLERVENLVLAVSSPDVSKVGFVESKLERLQHSTVNTGGTKRKQRLHPQDDEPRSKRRSGEDIVPAGLNKL
ncbi:cyclin-H-like [Dysidea avara]|uniref:cyclin-H-like n=1 Tax=Dysidea avara TaxID=196820 RepID=UPI00331AF694